MIQADPADDTSKDLGVGPSASEQTGEDYRPVTNWVYRGAMNPEFIQQHDEDERASDDRKQSENIERIASVAGGAQESSAQGQRNRGLGTSTILRKSAAPGVAARAGPSRRRRVRCGCGGPYVR